MVAKKTRVYIQGVGAALPNHVVPNETLSKFNGIEPDWIEQRTGIQSRYLSNRLEKTSNLATAAAREALNSCGVSPAEVDLLVLGTSFPDSHLPLSTAGVVKERLNLSRAIALDIHTPAIGYLLALQVAHQYLQSGGMSTALVVGAECFSSISDLRDRRTCYLFGDGAGAMLLGRRKGFATLSAPLVESHGLDSRTGGKEPAHAPPAVDDSYSLSLYNQPSGLLQEGLVRTWNSLLESSGLDASEIRHLVPQQMYIDAVVQATQGMKFPRDRLFKELLHSANLLSATLPVSFYHLVATGQAVGGDHIALIGTDGRFHWGGTVVSVTDPAPGKRRSLQDFERTDDLPGLIGSAEPVAFEDLEAASQLSTVLDEEVRRADAFGSHLSTIVITVGHPGRLSRTTLEQMGRETRLIFSRQVRRRDRVVQLKPNRYAVILPDQDSTDARRIAERLKGLLERLDPVEEIEINAIYDTLTFQPGEQSAAYVGEVVKKSGI